jgi:hypothetical protein
MRCPVCRAENGDGDLTCRRCRTDLSLLVRLEQQRRHLLQSAQNCLVQGQAESALAHAQQAQKLRQGPDSARLVALGHLVAGNFAEAWQWYSLATKP